MLILAENSGLTNVARRRLPEPKGLTYMELDILFQKRAGARKFREVRVCLEENGYFELVDEKNDAQHMHWEGVG